MWLTIAPVCFFCTVSLTITADDVFHVHHDGGVVLTAYHWADAHTVSLDNVCVLAIKAENTGDGAGLLASTSTGVVTDTSWKCSSGGGAVEQTGWHLPDFDDAAWGQARVLAANDGSTFRGIIAGINTEAKWIWAQNVTADVIYCRKSLC